MKTFLDELVLGACVAVALVGVMGLAQCAKRSYLTASDANDLIAAERDMEHVITRMDGGMPSADRALARGAFCRIDGVLYRMDLRGLDGGTPCR